MTDTVYYIICAVLTLGVLVGIALMSKVKTAVQGNLLSALCMAAAIIVTLYKNNIMTDWLLWACVAAGLVVGLIWASRIKMIEMPEIVALYNGFGGAASALVAFVTLTDTLPAVTSGTQLFASITGSLALAVGMITLTGSLVAGGKLHKILPQKPVIWKGHQAITNITLLLVAVSIVLIVCVDIPMWITCLICTVISGFFGVAFSIRVGGADMPITISLLNSLSGVAGAIAGMAIGDPLLVAVGGVVGASGLLLTQIMCKAMNRKLMDILLGKTSAAGKKVQPVETSVSEEAVEIEDVPEEEVQVDPAEILAQAHSVIIIPGYGMALAQAQHLVKQLADKLKANGAEVSFAIHPVAGRMPGHMNVLLAEADVPYEELHEMEEINPKFQDCDVAVIIGSNDVVNPAAREAEGTPIYGMPVLSADEAKHVIVCNYDLKPGYAGVENPLYSMEDKVTLLLGDAKETLTKLSAEFESAKHGVAGTELEEGGESPAQLLREAKKVIIIPGYGMALAQAQHLVKQLADKLKANGAEVSFAIHPVAGRMPGHMNVLLAEADVSYEELHEMDEINPSFAACDVTVIIGANDVVNPAARDAEGTPIYGMPVLNADQAKHVIICNYDLKPGYAGVDNPLYSREQGVTLLLGDAKETIQKLISEI